ncbi:histidinol phosphate phosphatase, partial [bacterium]|nr:histidinol phosphate phosphatase [bacterium]
MTITFEALEALVMETDAIAIHYFAKGVSVQQKADASPVTQADCEIESVIDRWRQTH